MQNTEVFIHVGLPKTASTYLQKVVYPSIKDSEFYVTGWTIENTYENDPFVKFTKGYVNSKYDVSRLGLNKEEVNLFLNKHNIKKLLLTCEAYTHNSECIEKLKELFPQAKIIITIRKQDSWIESLYKFRYFSLYPMSPQEFVRMKNGDFIKPQEGELNPNMFYDKLKRDQPLYIEQMDWFNLTKFYVNSFGAENVCVLPYEIMVKNKSEFFSRLFEFTNITPIKIKNNKRVKRSQGLLSWLLSGLIFKFEKDYFKKFKIVDFLKNNIDKYFYIPYNAYDKKTRTKIMDFHKKSNKKLQELIHINLEQYGYFNEQ